MSRALCLPAIFALLLTSALLAPDPQSAALARVQSASSGSPTLRFVVVGDTQDDGTTGGGINDNVWPAMAADMNALDPAFALFCATWSAGAATWGPPSPSGRTGRSPRAA